MTTQTKQILIVFVPSIALVIFLLLANKDYAILTKSEVNLLISQCEVVREDYKAALERLDPDGSEDPQTTCFDSLEDMRTARELVGQYLDAR